MAAQVTVIQIDDSEIRLLRGAWPALSVCVQKGIGGDGALAAPLKELAASLKLKRVPCFLIIPRKDIVLKKLEFPSSDPREVQRMIGLQIPTIVPFDEAQVIYHYHDVSVSEEGYSTVMAAVVPDQVVQRYIDAISAVGWDTSGVYVGFDGHYHYAQKFFGDDARRLSQTAFVVSNEHRCEVLIFHDGQLVFSYDLAYGRSDARDNDKEFARVLEQSLESCETTGRRPFDFIYFDSCVQDLERVKTALEERWAGKIGEMNVFAGLPGACRTFAEKYRMDASWMPLLGRLVKGEDASFMNFLPKRIRSSNIRKKNRKTIVVFVVSLLLTVVLSGTASWAVLHQYQLRYDALQKKISDIDPKIKGLMAEDEFFHMISRQNGEGHRVLDAVKEVYGMLPEDISLQYFSMQETGEFELQGVAEQDQSVNQLQAALVSSPYFQNVNLEYATKRKRFNKEYTEFKLTFKQVRK